MDSVLLTWPLSVCPDKGQNIISKSLLYGSAMRFHLRVTVVQCIHQLSCICVCDGVETLMSADDTVLYVHGNDPEQVAAKWKHLQSGSIIHVSLWMRKQWPNDKKCWCVKIPRCYNRFHFYIQQAYYKDVPFFKFPLLYIMLVTGTQDCLKIC